MVPPMWGSNHLSSFGVYLTQMMPVKLDKDNLLLWQIMILSIILGHNLEGHIPGTKVCPLEFIGTQITRDVEVSIEMTKNPQYNQLMSTDQLLMGWIHSLMTLGIAMKVMGSNNSNELWTAVNEGCNIQNGSRIAFLTSELQK